MPKRVSDGNVLFVMCVCLVEVVRSQNCKKIDIDLFQLPWLYFDYNLHVLRITFNAYIVYLYICEIWNKASEFYEFKDL